MKLPESIRIGGVEFEVIVEPRLNDGEKMLAGQIRHMDCLEYVQGDECKSS